MEGGGGKKAKKVNINYPQNSYYDFSQISLSFKTCSRMSEFAEISHPSVPDVCDESKYS